MVASRCYLNPRTAIHVGRRDKDASSFQTAAEIAWTCAPWNYGIMGFLITRHRTRCQPRIAVWRLIRCRLCLELLSASSLFITRDAVQARQASSRSTLNPCSSIVCRVALVQSPASRTREHGISLNINHQHVQLSLRDWKICLFASRGPGGDRNLGFLSSPRRKMQLV